MALVFPIVQSYKFKSKSQRVYPSEVAFHGVSDSSKLQIQKQITTGFIYLAPRGRVFPIVQSYKFKSKSQLQSIALHPDVGVSDSSKLQIQKQITTLGPALGAAR